MSIGPGGEPHRVVQFVVQVGNCSEPICRLRANGEGTVGVRGRYEPAGRWVSRKP